MEAKKGRKKLSENEETIMIGVKCPKSLSDELNRSVDTLKLYGENDATVSELIRRIVSYRSGNAVQIYKIMGQR